MSFGLYEDNKKLINDFGASPIKDIEVPNHYAFTNELVVSHRGFDEFYQALKQNKKCAIVSGVNASGTLHLGHKPLFDTLLFFQQEHDVPVFIPISDDESYVSDKVSTQQEGLSNAKALARELIAYGFDTSKTFLIIDQLYTPIYNLAIRFSKRVTLSEVKATYGYENSDNPGLFFYPAVQTAHVLFPLVERDFDHVLVPIGPDEDAHLRIARGIADKEKIRKPSVIHFSFLPGTDGQKMSKSKNNFIKLFESPKVVKKLVNKSLSGGQESVEEHRKLGGDADNDVAFLYLQKMFLSAKESATIRTQYESGELLSGELKGMLVDYLVDMGERLNTSLAKVSDEDVQEALIK